MMEIVENPGPRLRPFMNRRSHPAAVRWDARQGPLIYTHDTLPENAAQRDDGWRGRCADGMLGGVHH